MVLAEQGTAVSSKAEPRARVRVPIGNYICNEIGDVDTFDVTLTSQCNSSQINLGEGSVPH